MWIDPHFPPQQYQSVVQAFQEWENDTNHTVHFYQVSHEPIMGRPFIGVWRSNHKQIFGFIHKATTIGFAAYHGYDTSIIIDHNLPPNEFHSVALHEIGHALGLDHVEGLGYDYNSVMTPFTNTSSMHLTCVDVQLFCRAWECDASQMPLCK